MKTVKSYFFSFTLLGIFVSGFCPIDPSMQIKTPPNNGGLTLPTGFSALIVADKLGSGRHIAVNSNGDIYLALHSLHNGKGIVALRDTDGDGKADIIKYFGNTLTTGIAISDGFLYLSLIHI